VLLQFVRRRGTCYSRADHNEVEIGQRAFSLCVRAEQCLARAMA
jgi:hypothetical protein